MANQITNSALLQTIFKTGQLYIQSGYKSKTKPWEPEFTRRKTVRRFEDTSQIAGPGIAQERAEGTPSAIGVFQDWGAKRTQIRTYNMSIPLTYEVLADNLYADMAPKYFKSLLHSQIECQNVTASNVYSQAYNPRFRGWLPKPLLTTTLPIKDGFISNTLTVPSQPNEDTIYDLFKLYSNFRGPDGMRMDAKGLLGITSLNYARNFQVVLNSNFRTGTSSLETNPTQNLLSSGFKINKYMTPNLFFIRTDLDGLWFYDRETVRLLEDSNVSTMTQLINSMSRYGFTFDDNRCIVGAMATLGA